MDTLPDELISLILPTLNIFRDYKTLRLCCVRMKSCIDNNDDYKILIKAINNKTTFNYNCYNEEKNDYSYSHLNENADNEFTFLLDNKLNYLEELYLRIVISNSINIDIIKIFNDLHESMHQKSHICNELQVECLNIEDMIYPCMYGIIESKNNSNMIKFYELWKTMNIWRFIEKCTYVEYLDGIKFFLSVYNIYKLEIVMDEKNINDVIIYIRFLLEKNNIDIIKLFIDLLVNQTPKNIWTSPAKIRNKFNNKIIDDIVQEMVKKGHYDIPWKNKN